MAEAGLHQDACSGCTEYEFATRDHDSLPVAGLALKALSLPVVVSR
jgi:hypothetical protein